jgi:hypothetical protein
MAQACAGFQSIIDMIFETVFLRHDRCNAALGQIGGGIPFRFFRNYGDFAEPGGAEGEI